MTKFEFVLNKFYEITAWSLFAAVAMTVLNGGDDTVPASLLWQIPLLSFLGALSSLIYPWDRSMTRKEFVIRIAIHYLIMNGIVLGGGSLFGWFDIHEPLQVAMMALSVAIIFFIISLYSWTKGNRSKAEPLFIISVFVDKRIMINPAFKNIEINRKNIVDHTIRLAAK